MSVSLTTPTVNGFAEFRLSPALEKGIAAAGFTDPRPIQTEAIPSALAGKDIMGLAQTGTGKTAAFALPILEQILNGKPCGPQVLIVAPTRELAIQITEEIRLLARFTHVKVATLFGGVSASSQINTLRRRPDIIVACPGRLLDLYNQREVRLDRIKTLVLDEADHMFDMGFLPDIRRIIGALPEQRQNLLFSATMPTEIRRLAKSILNRPVIIELEHTKRIETIEHALYPVNPKEKVELLEHLLGEDSFVSAIVFTRTKHRARKLAKQLDASGHKAIALQGNMSQNQRDRAMGGFRKGFYSILVATDIVARGIDVEQVSHVVNFDMPQTPEGYTHRIGRTGRSERQGRAYTFVTAEDRGLVHAVERKIGESIPVQHLEGFTTELSKQRAAPPSDDRRGGRNDRGRGPARGRRSDSSSSQRSRPGAGGRSRAARSQSSQAPARRPRTDGDRPESQSASGSQRPQRDRTDGTKRVAWSSNDGGGSSSSRRTGESRGNRSSSAGAAASTGEGRGERTGLRRKRARARRRPQSGAGGQEA